MVLERDLLGAQDLASLGVLNCVRPSLLAE